MGLEKESAQTGERQLTQTGLGLCPELIPHPRLTPDGWRFCSKQGGFPFTSKVIKLNKRPFSP